MASMNAQTRLLDLCNKPQHTGYPASNEDSSQEAVAELLNSIIPPLLSLLLYDFYSLLN